MTSRNVRLSALALLLAIAGILFVALFVGYSTLQYYGVHNVLGGAVPLVNMMTGEVIFGGIGSGLYGMLVLAILTVFIAGLMVGAYGMETTDGELFDVDIPAFSLDSPHELRQVH